MSEYAQVIILDSSQAEYLLWRVRGYLRPLDGPSTIDVHTVVSLLKGYQ